MTYISNSNFTGVHYDQDFAKSFDNVVAALRLNAEALRVNADALSQAVSVMRAQNIEIGSLLKLDVDGVASFLPTEEDTDD